MKNKARQSDRQRTPPKITLTSAHQSPGKLLHDAHMLLSAGFVEALGQAGYRLPLDAWAVLNLLWEQDNLPQFEIGARIGRDRHQTSRLIDSLAQQRLAAREPRSGDRRVKCVVLTDAGRAAKSTLRRVATEYLERAFDGVIQQDYDALVRCLQHLVDKLKPTQEKEEAA